MIQMVTTSKSLPPSLQIAELIHRPLYFSSKSNNIRFDFPNYLSLDLLGVNTNTLYIPLTFSLPLSLPCKALNPTPLLYDCRHTDFAVFPSSAFFREILRLLSSTPQNISYQSTRLLCQNRDSPWGQGKRAFEEVHVKCKALPHAWKTASHHPGEQPLQLSIPPSLITKPLWEPFCSYCYCLPVPYLFIQLPEL